MDIPPGILFTAFGALAAVVAWQGRIMVANHEKCQLDSIAMNARIQVLSDKQSELLVTVIRENTDSNREVVDYLRKIRRELREEEPDSASDLHPVPHGVAASLERHNDDTTIILHQRRSS